MKLKRLVLTIIALTFLLGAATIAYAQDIGKPYVSLGYDNYDTLEEAVSVVPIGQEENDLVTAIEPKDSLWKPAWSHIPISRYWFDSSGEFIERWAGFIPTSGGHDNTGHKIILLISNITFTISVWFTRVSIELLLLAFNTHVLVNFGQEAIAIATSIWDGDGQKNGIKNTLLLLVLVLIGFYYIFRLLQAKFTDIIRASLITVLVLGMSAAYFANADRVLTTATNVVNSISASVFAVMPADEEIPIDNSQQRGLVGFAGKAWDVLVAAPWAYGQFGTTSTAGLSITSEERMNLEKRFDETSKNRLGSIERIDQVLLALPVGSKNRQEAVDIFQDEQIDHGMHPQTTWTLSPGRSMGVFILAGTSLIASLIFAVFCGFMGALLLIADITIIFGLLAAPFVAVIALVPETGWEAAIRWAKIMLSALLAKVFYGIYVGLVFLVLSTIMMGDGFSFFFKMLLLCIVLIFALVFRSKCMDMVKSVAKLDSDQKVNTGGSGRLLRQIVRYKQWKVIGKAVKNKGLHSKPVTAKRTAASNPASSTKEESASNPVNRRRTGNEMAGYLKARARPAQAPNRQAETRSRYAQGSEGHRYVVDQKSKNAAIYKLSNNRANTKKKKGAYWITDIKGMRDSEGRPAMSNAVREAMKGSSKFKHQPVEYQKTKNYRQQNNSSPGAGWKGNQYSSGNSNVRIKKNIQPINFRKKQ